MIQDFNSYLQARQVAFHENERIQQLEIQLYGNPRLGPKALEMGEARITEMKQGVETLREMIADYEAEQITSRLVQRKLARLAALAEAGLTTAGDSGGVSAEADEPRVVRLARLRGGDAPAS